MHNEIERNQSMIVFLKNKCCSIWQEVRQFLSFFDLLQFCHYLAIIDECKEAANQKKNERNLNLFFRHQLGNKAHPNKKNIVNLSDYKLSNTEEFVLSHKLNFCLPLSSVNREEVLAEFELLYAQLVHHKSQSVEQTATLRARLDDLAHAYYRSPIEIGDVKRVLSGYKIFAIQQQHSDHQTAQRC